MKKITSILVAFVLLFLEIQVVFADITSGMSNFKEIKKFTENQFTDVSANDWFYENVKKAYELGLVSGTSESTFAPDSDITIAETITLACRLYNTYNGNAYTFNYDDIWYQPYVDYAVQHEIINNGEYSDLNIKASRVTFAKILSKSLPKAEFNAINNISSGELPDVSDWSNWADSVYMLYNAGVLVGSDKYGSFCPTNTISRSEVSAIVTRIADKSLRKNFKLVSIIDELQGLWTYKPLKNQTVELTIDGKQFIKYWINDETKLGGYTKGTVSYQNSYLCFGGYDYGSDINVAHGIYNASYGLSNVTDSQITISDSFTNYTLNKINTSQFTEEIKKQFSGVLTLSPEDFYEFPYTFRTLTSITGVECTYSLSEENRYSIDKKEDGYIPGYVYYNYDIPLDGKNYYELYINYLDNLNGINKVDRKTERDDLYTFVTNIYDYQGMYRFAVSDSIWKIPGAVSSSITMSFQPK